MEDLLPIESPVPVIPDDWDFEIEDKNFDETIRSWRRMTVDVVSILWVFYKKLRASGMRTDLSQFCDRLPTWEEWLKEKGIGQNTPINHFKKLGWIEDKPHVSFNSGENEWYTPPEFIESAREVMGSIDVDPASSELANETVKAETYYTAETDGLNKEWKDNIWLNPPYSQPEISQFAEKVVLENENYSQATILVNNATDTQWLQSMMQISTAMCFVKTRIKFTDKYGDPGAPLQGQVILYIGNYITEFYNEFKKYGVCMKMMLPGEI